MKFESDTEMDRLLRRHARRKAVSSSFIAEPARQSGEDERSAATARASGAHMDADEMNAYAEGALPNAARTRYFSHLADCDECRSLVTQLTLAAGLATASSASTKAADVPTTRSWRDWLAALFAPSVLRYAVPALALLAVMAVAFVALRERREANFVAQNQPQASNSRSDDAIATANQNPQPTPPSTSTTAPNGNVGFNDSAKTDGNVQGRVDATTAAPETETQARKQEEAAVQETPTFRGEPKPAEPSTSENEPRQQTADRDEGATVAKAQPPPPVIASAPAAKAPANDERNYDRVDAKKSAETEQKNKTAAPADSASTGGIVLDGSRDNEQSGGRAATENSRRERAGAARSRSANTQLSREVAGPDAKDDSPAETRRAGGRQFRRQGSVWVDTAFNSSLSTVNVARGSEQYRALVADEPGLRSIAEQLGGTLIVVWKKRAYRIY